MGAVIERPLVWVGRDAAQVCTLVERAGGRLPLRGVERRRAIEPADVAELVEAGLVRVERERGRWLAGGTAAATLVLTELGERAVVAARTSGSRWD
jgi:hypothetical protein